MPPPPGTLAQSPPPTPSQSLAVPPPLPPRPRLIDNDEGLFACPRCTFLNHPALTSCEICGEPLISPNLPPILASAEAIDRGTSPAPFPIPASEERTTYVRLSFRASGEKLFLERIKVAISQKAWIPSSTKDNMLSQPPTSKTIGINGLERASAALKLQNDKVLEASFQDLEALMTRAKTVIALAEQLASKISSLPASAGASEARRALQESSELLGLSTPIVSREVAGGLEVYWEELARQVAEFLTAPGVEGSLLKREGGIIPLIDLFALYNRARGVGTKPVSPNGPTQTVRACACSISIVFICGVRLRWALIMVALVSPTDLAKACGMFTKLRLPIRPKTFRSGLIVIMDSSATEEVLERQLLTFITTSGVGVTALQVGNKFHWSVSVASELLQVPPLGFLLTPFPFLWVSLSECLLDLC